MPGERVARSLLVAACLTVSRAGAAAAQEESSASHWDQVEVPVDPFAGEYRLPRERELGTAAGQFRIIGSLMLVSGGNEPRFGLHGTLELMTFAYLGVRGSLESTLTGDSADALLFAAKAGPSLHVLPYRPIDLSLFFEAGIAVVEPTSKHSTPMPVLGPGGTFEVWLSHGVFLRCQVHMDWGIYQQGEQGRRYKTWASLLGLGIAL
jgi:hypothetical protein